MYSNVCLISENSKGIRLAASTSIEFVKQGRMGVAFIYGIYWKKGKLKAMNLKHMVALGFYQVIRRSDV